jgi:enoyl-CoA hydratase
MPEKEPVLMERREQVALIVFNRPESMNALNRAVNRRLLELLDEAEANEKIKVVVLTGSGDRAFVAGGDIREMKDLDSLGARAYALQAKLAADRIYHLKKPVIAAINGLCLGGGLEYALACDFRTAAHGARFALPEINLGIMPGSGGTQRLTRLVGMGRAKELLYTGEIFDAQKALDLGVINHVYPPATLIEETLLLANKIAAKSSMAIELIKSAVQTGAETDLESGLRLEIDCFGLCFSTKERQEAFDSFLNKDRPKIQPLP